MPESKGFNGSGNANYNAKEYKMVRDEVHANLMTFCPEEVDHNRNSELITPDEENGGEKEKCIKRQKLDDSIKKEKKGKAKEDCYQFHAFPLEENYIYKTIIFVRHAQALHNEASEKEGPKAYLNNSYFDAPLTEKGHRQSKRLKEHVDDYLLKCANNAGKATEEVESEKDEGDFQKLEDSDLMFGNDKYKNIELVIVSPLKRAIETALIGFEEIAPLQGKEYVQSTYPNLSCDEGTSNNNSSSSSEKSRSIPWISLELCREKLGLNPCDRRRDLSEIQTEFPFIDFSQIIHEEDYLWNEMKNNTSTNKVFLKETFVSPNRESKYQMAIRGIKFLQWLGQRKEKVIAVVSHSAFLFTLFQSVLSVQSDQATWFENAEMRILRIAFPKLKNATKLD